MTRKTLDWFSAHMTDPDGDRISYDDATLPSEGIQDDIFFPDDTEDGAIGPAGQHKRVGGRTMTFEEIEQVVPCFTPGTMIATPRGEVAVERLKAGDRVLTRDNGIQTLNWIGQKRLDFMELKKAPELRAIKIAAGALGDGMPERDMLVSPTHRMLITSHRAELYFGQSEILVPAKHMLAMDGVTVSDQPYVTYIHIMCDNHEILLADGAWSESFQPGDYTLKGFDEDQRKELFALFPELATEDGLAAYRAARRTLKGHEADLLFKG